MSDTWHLYENRESGNCWKVRQALAIAGVPFESTEVSVLGDRVRDRAGTPVGEHHAGKVPLLVGPDGTQLAESCAILLWFLDGTSLMPADKLQRHRVFEWLFFEQSTHEPSVAVLRFMNALDPESGRQNPEVEAATRKRALAALAVMEKHLVTTGSWFVGDACTIADLALYPYTKLAPEAGIDVAAEFPAIAAWLERVEGHPNHLPIRGR